ncbi:zincin-like metallopeptidase toxin domain-containing protein [Chryseobacterium wangxinyae]|uniref:zincin-like metallopeptidase toxin domain-containing protein n=1 Tax=Chryseobacterium sp. CY350 TaxID=2997336 RepID=UPI0022711E8A|nr:zincin-like metallopeptidase toxin domain-containing protein [Chryseobacterium sp. CY350]WBZ94053.1 zincin-like metallopeptidase toxin domain-containing protein [Chryseobacterium sp. CY350]
MNSEKVGQLEETRTENEDIDPGYFYNPMSPVIYLGEEGEPKLITALFIKAIADEKEWARVMQNIRIGGDIFAIILGVITLGATSEFSALAIADLALASVDLSLMNEDVQKWLSQYPEGKWFVENWDLIYALVGAGIMSVVMIEGILTHGPALLERVKNLKNIKENYLIFTKQLEKLIAELDIYKARTATNIIEEVVITAKKNALLEKLLKPFLSSDANLEYIIEQLAKRKISVKKAGDNLYEIYYNGKLVTATDANEAGVFLKDNFWKTEKQLQEVAKMAKPHDIDKYLGGKILKESQIRKFRGDLKKRGTALILEEDILLNKSGQITNKAVVKNFKPVILDRFKFDNIYDLYNYLRRKGYAGLFDHQNKQIILTKNPTEYLIFHEMGHLKHLEEIKDIYKTLQPWQRETYVFEEIWKQRHLWTKKELQHALNYVNFERKNAGQSLIIKKL